MSLSCVKIAGLLHSKQIKLFQPKKIANICGATVSLSKTLARSQTFRVTHRFRCWFLTDKGKGLSYCVIWKSLRTLTRPT